jgi:hypothetical protein
MGWLSEWIEKPAKDPISGAVTGFMVGGPVGAAVGAGVGAYNQGNDRQRREQEEFNRQIDSIENLTPVQQRALRQQDIDRGMARGQEIFFNDPRINDIASRRKDLADGLNAKEMDAARGVMQTQMDNNDQRALRELLAGQGRAGVGGSRGAAQRAELKRKMNIDRANEERQYTLNQYEAKRQGLDDYQNLEMNRRFGQLAQGMGEAQLGVAERTGYMQNEIGREMARAAGKQPKQGILSTIFDGIF